MKKRLLSAALALAMVLTLLPVSAFAAPATGFTPATDWSAGDVLEAGHGDVSVTYRDVNSKDSYGNVYTTAGWYHLEPTAKKIYSATSGVVGGTSGAVNNATGTWYVDASRAIGRGAASFLLIDAQTISTTGALTGLTVDLNGNTLTWGIGSIPANSTFASVTVNNTADTQGQFSGTITAAKNFTVTVNKTKGPLWFNGGVSITHTSASKVTVNGANMSGGVTLTGSGTSATGASVEVKNGGNVGGVTITNQSSGGSVTVTESTVGASIQLDTGSAGTISVDSSTVNGGIFLYDNVAGGTGTGGTITVKGTKGISTIGKIRLTAKTGGAITLGASGDSKINTGNITLNSDSNGSITAYNVQQNGTTRMRGVGTTLNGTSCNFGAIRVVGSTDPTVTTGNAPKVMLTGNSNATSILTWSAAENAADEPGGGNECLTGAYTIDLSGNTTVTDTIQLPYGNVTLDSSHATNGVTLLAGTLALKGSEVHVGNIVLGSTTNFAEAKLDVASGTKVMAGNISETAGHVNNINIQIPTGRVTTDGSAITYGTIGALNEPYTKQGVKGGNFATDVPFDLRAKGLTYRAAVTGKYSYYYGTAEDVNQLVKDYQATTGLVVTLGAQTIYGMPLDNAATSGAKTLTLTDSTKPSITGSNTVLVINFTPPQSLPVPSVVNGQNVAVWTNTTDKNDQVTGGGEYGAASTFTGATLDVTTSGYAVTKITNVSVLATPTNQDAKNATATLNGTVITLGGAISGSGSVIIPLQLQTDSGTYVKVEVSYNTSTGYAQFLAASVQPPVLTVTDGGDSLMVQSSNNLKYTLNASGLKGMPDGLVTNVNPEIVTKVNSGVNKDTVTYLKELGEYMTTNAAGCFDYSGSPAINQAIGAAIANVNTSSFSGWITAAQRAAWAYNPDNANVKNPTADQLRTTGYNQVCFVPYLDVQISGYNNQGAFTATMTPSYRIEIRQSTVVNAYKDAFKDNGYTGLGYVATKGSLGALTSTMGSVNISLPVKSDFTFNNSGAGHAHQDNTHSYPVTLTTGTAPAPNTLNFTVTHAAEKSGSGFGTIVVNSTAPQVTLDNSGSTEMSGGNKLNDALVVTGSYDSLQAAVNDVANLGTITVGKDYTGSMSFSVPGLAKTFYVTVENNEKLTVTNAKDVSVVGPNSGKTYTIELTKDNVVVKPATDTIPITVATVTGGTGRASASSAKAGETVTVTLTPATGYRANGVSATAYYTTKNANGTETTTSAAVSVSGSGNVYSFKVPENATRVTVTPAFAATTTNTGVTISVSNTSEGTAVTSAGNNKVPAGSSVTVTTVPGTGRRTMGLYVTSNAGTTTATRTGVNSFVFNVPAGATNVVVTPRFDTNNGTVFEDVWSTDYYSSAVAWAVGRNITDGTSTYLFSPGSTCNRVQMVTFLWRAAGRPSTAGMVNPFYDVSPSMGSDFYNAILWANNKGITQGDGSANRFNPYGTITRAQAVTFLWRYAGKPAAASYSGFYDVPTNEYYAQAVTWAVGKGITNGDGSTVRFNPNGACLRAQIVTFLYRQSTGVRA